ncbi:MAG TPA: hypothetical protein VJ044_02160, partial [Candidatus Hodarchaeales archaeon]|nr:hypothetical protein [Candidatus Hodarchaeales archaeon]
MTFRILSAIWSFVDGIEGGRQLCLELTVIFTPLETSSFSLLGASYWWTLLYKRRRPPTENHSHVSVL